MVQPSSLFPPLLPSSLSFFSCGQTDCCILKENKISVLDTEEVHCHLMRVMGKASCMSSSSDQLWSDVSASRFNKTDACVCSWLDFFHPSFPSNMMRKSIVSPHNFLTFNFRTCCLVSTRLLLSKVVRKRLSVFVSRPLCSVRLLQRRRLVHLLVTEGPIRGGWGSAIRCRAGQRAGWVFIRLQTSRVHCVELQQWLFLINR